MANNSHTLLELTQSIERLINHTYSKSYWVTAEISRLNLYPKSGHCYPELVEKSNNQIVAEIRSTIWAGTYKRIDQVFKSVTGEKLTDGMQVMFRVEVKFSPKHGVSLNILDIDPQFTLGAMAKERIESIKKLQSQGVYNQNQSLTFPTLPNNLAIISVSSSKGYKDFLETLSAKSNNYNISFDLFPAILQGDNAVKSISDQLYNISKVASNYDCVIIIRGGGGDVGLHCYNNFKLANAVATFPLPVVSGIGHSTNETVVELVANSNKITPTAAAEFILNFFLKGEINIENALDTFRRLKETRIEPEKRKVVHLLQNLKIKASIPLQLQKMQIQKLGNTLINSSNQIISRQKITLKMQIAERIKSSSQNLLQNKRLIINQLQQEIKLSDPSFLLKKGYAIPRINGKVLSSTKDVSNGEEISVQLQDGLITTQITKIESNE